LFFFFLIGRRHLSGGSVGTDTRRTPVMGFGRWRIKDDKYLI
jgi:hypothetical protein